MGLRKGGTPGHTSDQLLSVEVVYPDELAKPNADAMDVRLEEAKRVGRPFKAGNKAARGRRPMLARLGIKLGPDAHKNKAYQGHLRLAEAYRRRRITELRVTHGFVSVAAMSIMATAALQLAMSRYMMELAVEAADMDLIKKASSLGNDARQNELAAWELCVREASTKSRQAANQAPWLAGSKGEAVKLRVPDVEPEVAPSVTAYSGAGETGNTTPWEGSQVVETASEPKQAYVLEHDKGGSGTDIPQGSGGSGD
jgi:hypothetical protein